MEYSDWVGLKVRKCGNRIGANVKPFKSGGFVNTVTGVINHPQLNIPAFTFAEDDSYVECRRCVLYMQVGYFRGGLLSSLEEYGIKGRK